MKLTNKLGCIVFLILLTSCTFMSNDKNSSYQYYLNTYSSIFNDTLLSHFPNNVDSLFDFYHCRSKNENPEEQFLKRNSLVLINQVSNTTKDSVKQTVVNAKQIINSFDSCALIVNAINQQEPDLYDEFNRITKLSKHENIEKEIDSLLFELVAFRQQNCNSLTLPIPNFSPLHFYEYEITSLNRLTDDFVLYILDAKSGKYLPKEYLTTGLGMPDNWKNGFSKGIAISENRNIIVYWLEIW